MAKQQAARAPAGWLREGGVSCLQHCGVLSAHRMQQPPQPNHLAKQPGSGPDHFTMWLSSGGCFGSWATANGKNKTKQHTQEIRSLRCYLPEPLGPVSRLLHLYGSGERELWVERASGQVCVSGAGGGHSADKTLNQEWPRGAGHTTAHCPIPSVSRQSRWTWAPIMSQLSEHWWYRRSRTRNSWQDEVGKADTIPKCQPARHNSGSSPSPYLFRSTNNLSLHSLIFLSGNHLGPDHINDPPPQEPDGEGCSQKSKKGRGEGGR